MPAYVKHDLGRCEAGAAVEVTPAQDARVYLLDEPNLGLYLRRRRFQGVGVEAAAAGTTLRLPVPTTGRWAVVIDLGGARGTIRASVRRLGPAEIDADVADVVRPAVTSRQLLGDRQRR